MNNIAIIPARSGSKGLKDKNIKYLAGRPLLVYSIVAAQKSNQFTEIMVSTDSEKYAQIAREYGGNVPFLRSRETSGDNSGSWDVVKEVLSNYKSLGKTFDTVCLLQPTSPLRTEEDIINGYRLFAQKGADAITGVCEVDHSPLWTMTLDNTLSLDKYKTQRVNRGVPRQKLEQYYRINGAIYIRKVVYEDANIELLDKRELAFIMDRKRSIDIDSIDDFELAEFYMSKR